MYSYQTSQIPVISRVLAVSPLFRMQAQSLHAVHNETCNVLLVNK
jgi:hypothetical protein